MGLVGLFQEALPRGEVGGQVLVGLDVDLVVQGLAMAAD